MTVRRMKADMFKDEVISLKNLMIATVFLAMCLLCFISVMTGSSYKGEPVSEIGSDDGSVSLKVAKFNTDCITDETGFIEDIDSFKDYLLQIHKGTGLQPFIVIKDYEGISDGHALAESLLSSIADSDNVLLCLYLDDKSGTLRIDNIYLVTGNDVGRLIDYERLNDIYMDVETGSTTGVYASSEDAIKDVFWSANEIILSGGDSRYSEISRQWNDLIIVFGLMLILISSALFATGTIGFNSNERKSLVL